MVFLIEEIIIKIDSQDLAPHNFLFKNLELQTFVPAVNSEGFGIGIETSL